MFLHHLYTQASVVGNLLISAPFAGEACYFLLARGESCEMRETRVGPRARGCIGSAHLFALNEKIRVRESNGIEVRDADGHSQMVPFWMMKRFLPNCWLSCVDSRCFFPPSLEASATIEDLIRNWRFRFH